MSSETPQSDLAGDIFREYTRLARRHDYTVTYLELLREAIRGDDDGLERLHRYQGYVESLITSLPLEQR